MQQCSQTCLFLLLSISCCMKCQPSSSRQSKCAVSPPLLRLHLQHARRLAGVLARVHEHHRLVPLLQRVHHLRSNQGA